MMLTPDEPLKISQSSVLDTLIGDHLVILFDLYLKVKIPATVRVASYISVLTVLTR